jgi:hypothetical protein
MAIPPIITLDIGALINRATRIFNVHLHLPSGRKEAFTDGRGASLDRTWQYRQTIEV